MAAEPQLMQLVTLARQAPSQLGPLLQSLSSSAPHLVAMIQTNQQVAQQTHASPKHSQLSLVAGGY